jgi:hypothetical protein
LIGANVKKQKVEKLFNKLRLSLKEYQKTRHAFDDAVRETYGFHYDEYEASESFDIIEAALSFGDGEMDFKSFDEIMQDMKRMRDRDDE